MMKRMETAAVAADNATDAPGKIRVRDRIFDTACELFYNQGIRSVGVDAIASEAGTNKMSFYRSFSSKDELVAEYLRDSEREFWDWWDGVVAPYAGDPRRQCEALFDRQAHKPCEKNQRGCPMANAAVEIREDDHPALQVVRAHKAEIRERFRTMAREMGARNPDVLGDGLMMLMSGSIQSRLIFPCDTGPAVNVSEVARRMIDAYLNQ
jgi:AcrR family transcriptional regulator